MKRFWAGCLAAVVALGICGGAARGSEGYDDIAKLAKSGVTEDVLVAFVQASPIPYELTVDEILFLNDLGVTPKTIQEVMNHGRDMRAGKAPVVADPVVAENNEAAKPLDDVPVVDHTLDQPDPSLDTANLPVGQDPNGAQTYFSPLTGQISSAPEVIREKEIVRETVYVPTPVTEVEECSTSHFYETLTPYGTWVDINGTWCWQPSVVNSDPNWRPYCNRGHWVWSDCGWCWESDYSWGWAPFHYGRWWRANGYGWMWTPDTVWGPAWVNWRESDSHWGWAPLPPACRFETSAALGVGFHFGGRHFGLDIGVGLDFGLNHNDYCFVPQDRFCDHQLNVYIVGRDQEFALYRGTHVIQNNITIVKTTNNIFVNGPSSTLVAERTHIQLRPFRIASSFQAGQVLSRGTVEDRQNGVLSFYRPRVTQVSVETPLEIASRQVARQSANIRPVADARILAVSARADELRERNFATQDARRQEALLKQSAVVEEAAVRRSDSEQRRLTAAIGRENNAEQKALFTKQLEAENLKAKEARLQKESIEKQAADQRKLVTQLATERDRVAHAQATTESAKLAADTKVRLAAERAERETANRDAALRADKALADQRARAAATKTVAKDDAQAKAQAAELEHNARIEADRQARESNRKVQDDLQARQKAQLEAEKAERLKTLQDRTKTKGTTSNETPSNTGAAANKATHDTPHETPRDTGRETGRDTGRGQPSQQLPVNPKTGQTYDPNNPNDPNNPRKGK